MRKNASEEELIRYFSSLKESEEKKLLTLMNAPKSGTLRKGTTTRMATINERKNIDSTNGNINKLNFVISSIRSYFEEDKNE